MSLRLRAPLAFLALPGVVACAVPLAIGVTILLWCVRACDVTGEGTRAPWAPPRHRVRSGPYRCCRNPMYVGVTLILLGWAELDASVPVLVYGAAVLVAFHLRMVRGEEPALARVCGDDWQRYRARTPRWAL